MVSMKRWTWRLLLGAAVLVAPAKLPASEGRTAQVYQPFDVLDGRAVSAVTYTGYFWPGEEVEMTCWPNRVWHEHGDWRQVQHQALQENLAFTFGLTVTIDGTRSWPSQGDTIVATLDASRLASMPDTIDVADTTLIAMTVECMKANAAQSAPAIRFLTVTIVGPRQYAIYGGCFDVSGYQCGPRRRDFP